MESFPLLTNVYLADQLNFNFNINNLLPNSPSLQPQLAVIELSNCRFFLCISRYYNPGHGVVTPNLDLQLLRPGMPHDSRDTMHI